IRNLQDQEKRLARIVIPDEADTVHEVNVQIPRTAVQTLADGESDLEIFTENVRIYIPNSSMNEFENDLFFRVVPVKAQEEKKVIEERVKKEELVQEASGGLTVQILG